MLVLCCMYVRSMYVLYIHTYAVRSTDYAYMPAFPTRDLLAWATGDDKVLVFERDLGQPRQHTSCCPKKKNRQNGGKIQK